jgi:hypothetical protein
MFTDGTGELAKLTVTDSSLGRARFYVPTEQPVASDFGAIQFSSDEPVREYTSTARGARKLNTQLPGKAQL